MSELIRTFFIFSFAVVAFSQYLRTSSSTLVNDLRNRSRVLDDNLRMLCGNDDEKFKKVLTNKEYEHQREILFSTVCDVNHDAYWFYILFIYLAFLVIFASVECFFRFFGVSDLLLFLYIHKREITGAYCLLGVLINLAVFISGYKATIPRSNARSAHSSLETIYRAITFSI